MKKRNCLFSLIFLLSSCGSVELSSSLEIVESSSLSVIDYGTLTVNDIKDLMVGKEETISFSFSKSEYQEDITYSFTGNDIEINDGKVKALNPDCEVKVTAKTNNLETTFTIKTVKYPYRDVVILCGQSNAQGHSLTSGLPAEEASYYKKNNAKVLISYYNNEFGTINSSNNEYKYVTAGQGMNRSTFGIELGMAEEIKQANLTYETYFIKYAYGGTTLYSDWKAPNSRLFTGIVDYTLEALGVLENDGYIPVIKAICWMQGESDADATRYKAYENLEDDFIYSLLDAFIDYSPVDGQIAFIDAGISNVKSGGNYVWAKYEEINEAKQNNASKDSDYRYYIDTIAAGLINNTSDIYHYTSSSELLLGKLFGEVLIENKLLG